MWKALISRSKLKFLFCESLLNGDFCLRCTSETKSDYVELSNFQNRDRFYSRFCGTNKPSSVLSDASFFHVTFYSNNVFDAKGFQASYYFLNLGNYSEKNRL